MAVGPALPAGGDGRRARRARLHRAGRLRDGVRGLRRRAPTARWCPPTAGPAYSPHGLLEIDAFVTDLLRDAEANGLRIGQFHAEYGPGQVELSLGATDPVRAADEQLLARQTVLAAAARHGLRISFAPLPSLQLAGNGWHVHSSLWRDGAQPARRRPRGARHGRQSATSRASCATCRRSPPSPRPRSAPGAAAAGLLRGRLRLLGHREPRGPRPLRRGLAAARRRPRQRRAQGLRRLGEPLPRPHRAADLRRGRRRGEPRPAVPDRRGPRHLEEEGAGRRGRREAAHHPGRPGGRAARVPPDHRGPGRRAARARSSRSGAPTPPGRPSASPRTSSPPGAGATSRRRRRPATGRAGRPGSPRARPGGR